MKRTAVLDRKSRFWSRLLGLLIVFAIISVLVFGGVKNLMGELSAVYEDLAASQSELAVTHHELAATQTELDSTQQELATTANKLDRQTLDYVGNVRQLNYSRNLIVALANEKEQLKRSLSAVVSDLSKSHRQLHATDNALRAVEAELERQMSLPQVSVIVTTERLMQKSQRELFAASHVRMLAAGDDGMMFYEGQEMLHEVESSALYAERTQTIVTQTAPGRDVLECLNDASLNCSMVIAYRAIQR